MSGRIFLLSPASCSGRRAQMVLNPKTRFHLAERLRSREGAPLGEVFAFLSGLYFRGKLAYARQFARPPAGTEGVLIITSGAGLVPAGEPVTLRNLKRFAEISIDVSEPRYRRPLAESSRELASLAAEDSEIVLLGSIASGKYVDILGKVFGERLVFPADFVGRGDMSRGGLMLRRVGEGRELDYTPVLTAVRHGPRPPRLPQTPETPVTPRRPATRDYHPAKTTRARKKGSRPPLPAGEGRGEGILLRLPTTVEDVEVRLGPRSVRLTNLKKLFWPDLGITKRDLLQYYADVSPYLLPHLRDRAMVMKRYPHGASGEFFFMKRAPSPRPDWIEICSIEHSSGNIIDFPMIQDLPSLLWVINLGCIDLNQWYATCDDVDRPDYVHFDLDPVPGADFRKILDTALLVHESLDALKMPNYAKTTGSKGIHVYVPIVRGPTQKDVWTFAKKFAFAMEQRDPKLVTAEYKISKRPEGRVLVDYNQNAWGRTLASIYSVRPKPRATVSTPVTWKEIERGVSIEHFRMDNVPARLAKKGDLWKPLLEKTGRFRLDTFL